ncbi:MAG: hypothetical protein LBP59_11190 [Planctomycetaceae bacterium]|jgi:hypothetical protein|nr:hypothetical protein [Planctomycetaceae bacterium]
MKIRFWRLIIAVIVDFLVMFIKSFFTAKPSEPTVEPASETVQPENEQNESDATQEQKISEKKSDETKPNKQRKIKPEIKPNKDKRNPKRI